MYQRILRTNNGTIFAFLVRDIIRKKAVMAALWFYHLDPSVISSVEATFEKTLCDRSPAVMGATLNVFLKFVEVS